MFFTYLIIALLIVCVCLVDLFVLCKLFESVYCWWRHQPPLVASPRRLRRYVVNQVVTHYPHAKNICEIGSGFGGLARAVARNSNAKVYALENMPFSAFVSKVLDIVSCCKNNKTVWCDAFKFLANTNTKFDIAIAYMGPTATPLILKYQDKINVLISLDFEIKELHPKQVIDMGPGATIYNKVKYPHKLFVYEFK